MRWKRIRTRTATRSVCCGLVSFKEWKIRQRIGRGNEYKRNRYSEQDRVVARFGLGACVSSAHSKHHSTVDDLCIKILPPTLDALGKRCHICRVTPLIIGGSCCVKQGCQLFDMWATCGID